MTIMTALFGYGCEIASNYWMTIWTGESMKQLNDPHGRNFHLGVYSVHIVSQGVLLLIASLALYLGNLNAARVVHKELLYRVLRAPVSFFDVTPIGRILNRFSRDIASVHFELPAVLYWTITRFSWAFFER